MTAHREQSSGSAECRDRSQLPIHGSRALYGSSSDGPLDAEAVRTVAAKFDFVISEWNGERRRSRCGGSNFFLRAEEGRKTFIVFHTVIIKQTTERRRTSRFTARMTGARNLPRYVGNSAKAQSEIHAAVITVLAGGLRKFLKKTFRKCYSGIFTC